MKLYLSDRIIAVCWCSLPLLMKRSLATSRAWSYSCFCSTPTAPRRSNQCINGWYRFRVDIPNLKSRSSRCCYFASTTITTNTPATHHLDTAPTTTTAVKSQISAIEKDFDGIYHQLQDIATLLRHYDDLYYNGQATITDEEYDALAEKEAALCREYPDLWKKWQTESGLGVLATRYQGRVGTIQSTNQVSIATTTGMDKPTRPNRRKNTHLKSMLSLDNVHNTEQLLDWLERVRKKVVMDYNSTNIKTDGIRPNVTILTEPKLDGLSLCLHYEQSIGTRGMYELKWAATRGDGHKGNDVTRAVQDMGTIPFYFRLNEIGEDLPDVMEVRGEVVLPRSVFENIQRQQDSTDDVDSSSSVFTNCRNAASGILLRFKEQEKCDANSETVDMTKSHQLRSMLRFYAYNIVTSVEDSATDPLVRNGLEIRTILERMGFTTPQPIETTTLTVPDNDTEAWSDSNVTKMMTYYEALKKYRLDEKSEKGKGQGAYEWGDYVVDGCVHKIVEEPFRVLLGSSNRAPRWAVAHKFPPTTVVTDLLDVEVQVGRLGTLTPVAILRPVDIGGVSVQRATLHNFPFLRRIFGADRIRKGSSIMVRRAGKCFRPLVWILSKRYSVTSPFSFGFR